MWRLIQQVLTHVNLVDILFIHYLGNYYIADWGNHRVRKVTISTGIMTTYAGTGSTTYSGDNGQATAATLCYPYGVVLDAAGKLQRNSLFSG